MRNVNIMTTGLTCPKCNDLVMVSQSKDYEGSGNSVPVSEYITYCGSECCQPSDIFNVKKMSIYNFMVKNEGSRMDFNELKNK